MEAEPNDRASAGLCLEAVELPTESYRLGNTKVSSLAIYN